MVDLLVDNEFLLLFIVAGLGFLVGKVKVAGFSLGVSAVLFVGLAIGALDEDIRLPDFVYLFGLILFVYTVGLASGPGFVAALKRRGVRDNAFVLVMLSVAAVTATVIHLVTDLRHTFTAGMFAGSLTNTPALAAVLQYQTDHVAPAMLDSAVAEPVVGYSVAYPIGVLGMIIAIYVMQRIWKVDYAAEAKQARDLGLGGEELVDVTIRIAGLAETTVAALLEDHGWRVLFGRRMRDGEIAVCTDDTKLRDGDLVSVIGVADDVDLVAATLGERTTEQLYLDRRVLDFRRVFVSSRHVAGKSIGELQLPRRFGAIITRVRRGDIDLLAEPNTVLEPGDRVRVVAPRNRMQDITTFFGDSYKALSEIDIAVFSLGIALGILVGMIPIPLPGGTTFKLGLAGGPLVVGLVLGALDRTGPITWQLPYNANLTLRQLGVILFLAGVGTRSGYAFASTLSEGGGLTILVGGAIITMSTAFLTLWIGHRFLHIPAGMLIGMLAGLQTQPAVLAFANEQAGNEMPGLGFVTVNPVAQVSKILFAQVLIVFLA